MNDIARQPSVRSYPLSEIARRFELELRAPRDTAINSVAPLHRAGPDEISFLTGRRHRDELVSCRAAAIVLSSADAAHWSGAALLSKTPYADFARIAQLFETLPDYPVGIHPRAWVDPDARLEAGVRVAAGAVISAGAVIGAGCTIGPGCVIEARAQIGRDSRLVANVTIGHQVQIGKRNLIHPGAVIGADGFGQAWYETHWVKVPQLGRVITGDDCEIGANTTIDRGALDDTVLADDVRIDNLVQIAHNVQIGAHTAIAACVGIAGSARIGRYCLIGGAAAILGHIHICDRVTVQGMSSITHSITEAGEYGSAVAAQDARSWRRNLVRLRNLDNILRELTRTKK